MMKKILTVLLLIGFVLPLAAGAVERPVTKLERCTLRHDFTKQFGPEYARGTLIVAETTGATGGTTGGTAEFPDGVELAVPADFGDLTYGGTAGSIGGALIGSAQGWPLMRTVLAFMRDGASVLGVSYGGATGQACKDAIGALINASSVTKTHYYTLRSACGTGSGENAVVQKGDDITRNIMRQAVHAKSGGVGGGVELPDASIVCLLDLIETVGDWIFAVVIIFAGIFILWGGATMVFAAGAPEKIKKARDILIWAAVGVAIAFLSKGLIKLVEQIIT